MLNDPFLKEQLNPLFLLALDPYWEAAFQPNPAISEAEIPLIRQGLMRFLFRRLTLPLFYEARHKVSKGLLFLLTYIHSDGMGDFFALLNSAKVYRKAFPEMDIQVVFTHHQELPAINPQDYGLKEGALHDFRETAVTQRVLEPVLEGKSKIPFESALDALLEEKRQTQADFDRMKMKHGHESLPLKEMLADLDIQIRRFDQSVRLKEKALALYEKIKKADALVHISLAINTFENPLLAPKSLYFSETGNFQGVANSLAFQWYSQGMLPFEEGIFLEGDVGIHDDWRDKRVPLYFWKTETPAEEDYKQYQAQRQLYMGYFPRIPDQLLVFIYYTAVAQKEKKRHLDLFVPKIHPEVIENLDYTWLEKHHVHKVVHVELNQDKETTLFESRKTGGKTMRLIHLAPIPERDFYHLMHLSGELVGCTGDMSLSECLKGDQIPFYELRMHKQETWLAFGEIARYLNLKVLSDYLKVMEESRSNLPEATAVKVTEILESAEFKHEWKDFLGFVRRYYSLEKSLTAHLSRHLLFSRSPQLNLLEDALIASCLDGTLTLQQACHQLRSKM